MSKLLMKLISLIACFGLLLNANYINTYANAEHKIFGYCI